MVINGDFPSFSECFKQNFGFDHMILSIRKFHFGAAICKAFQRLEALSEVIKSTMKKLSQEVGDVMGMEDMLPVNVHNYVENHYV